MSKWILASVVTVALAVGCDTMHDTDEGRARTSGARHRADARPGSPELSSGRSRTHDPSLIREGRGAYVFSTGDPAVAGGTIRFARPRTCRHGRSPAPCSTPSLRGSARPYPASRTSGRRILEHAGTYYLYYSASTFGSNRSVIGLATNETLDPTRPNYAWVDRGQVFGSVPSDDFNAIDPAVIADPSGVRWMAFGSFWSGIRMVRLEWPSGKVADTGEPPLRLADRFVPPNAIEAPAITRHGGYYYLFVSLDFCCRGLGSTYKVAVGRSRSVTGPYFDQLGTPLQHGGGTVILSERGDMFGPGGQSVVDDLLVYHYYDAAANGDFRLGIRKIRWEKGWPVVAERD